LLEVALQQTQKNAKSPQLEKWQLTLKVENEMLYSPHPRNDDREIKMKKA